MEYSVLTTVHIGCGHPVLYKNHASISCTICEVDRLRSKIAELMEEIELMNSVQKTIDELRT